MPILIPILIIISINNYMDKKLPDLLNQKDLSKYESKYDNITRDNGILFKEYVINRGDMFLAGSSEIRIDVPQSARNMFPILGGEYNICSYGRSGVQDLQHATALGSLNIEKNSKITYMVSPQWFERKDGIKSDNFIGNFSELQFYKFLNNPKISRDNKIYYCSRVFDCLRNDNKFLSEAIYARMYLSNNVIIKFLSILTKPYYYGYEYLLETKDKVLTYKDLMTLEDKSGEDKELKKINWNKELKDINNEIVNTNFNNDFYVDNKWYNDNLKNIKNNENKKNNDKLTNSKEIKDYEFYLSVCKEIGVNPYIIILPYNGFYEDFTKLNIERRHNLYDIIKNITFDKEYKYLDLRDYEYKKGFFIDVSHPGKEGWLKISEGIFNEYSKR